MCNHDEIILGKKVIQAEMCGLDQLSRSLDENFSQAVNLMYNCDRVVISGMGKPGHIGRKISATLASIGTMSFFLHPAEASHGDMGMISSKDCLLILSLSGKTVELLNLIDYAKRFGIPIIAITANSKSPLADSANVILLLPTIDEAEPNNLAPTTSTTMMVALGDALAVCLIERKKFNREDFKKLHPGGALGKKLLKVCDLMHTDLPICQSNDIMKDVIISITEKSFGCCGVLDNEKRLIGIITDGDLRRHISDNLLSMYAKDVMTCAPVTLKSEQFASEALNILNSKKITNMFIVDNDSRPIGILHIHDCLRAGVK